MGMKGNLRLLRVAALVGIVATVVGAQAAGVGLAQAAFELVPHARSASGSSQHARLTGRDSGAGHTPVTLCHATSSQTNPFVVITTDDDGVLGAGQSGGNGHDSHGGDIIPPFDYTDNNGAPQSYPGKNWDAAGQAILAGGCEPPEPPCPDDLSLTGGDNSDNGCEPPPCPEELSMTGDGGDNGCEPPPCPDELGLTGGGDDNGNDGCEPPPCPDDVSMTGDNGGGDDNGCEPPPCPDDLSMTGGDNGDNGDECEEEKTKLVVEKIVINDNDGTATPDDFSFQVNGGSAQSFESDGRNVLEVDPGTYTVTEPLAAGYATTYDNCDAVVIEKGESETCTITNDDEPEPPEHGGRVIVEKVMNGGTDTFEFTGTPAGSISVDGGTISADVAPGQYTTTELPTAGWNLGSISCDDENSSGSISKRTATFNVEEGETVTCTFRNRKR
ncbi:MAG: prealbumin-like fold domain-containing protein, partial [Gaiellaceae bacterium]